MTAAGARLDTRLRRSCLSVPGHAVRMHEKALSVPADEVVFDLEDAVAPSAKPEAREAIARQVATLDALSGGRVIFGAGLGGPIEDEFGSFGDCTDPRVLAARLDEGLELLCRYWSGDVVNHDGPHFQVHDVRLLPGSVQRPRPPIWIGGFWPRRRPMRRAAQWDGVAPLFDTARHGQIPAAHEVRELVAYVDRHRPDRDAPFEVVLGGATSGNPVQARDQIAPLAQAGATWWDERQLQASEDLHRREAVLRRIEQGPPDL